MSDMEMYILRNDGKRSKYPHIPVKRLAKVHNMTEKEVEDVITRLKKEACKRGMYLLYIGQK